ncbi:MAG TPA: serine/threonine-protein kinase [Polyangiaceae bacterium]|jgi:serine/threonine-protein kinase
MAVLPPPASGAPADPGAGEGNDTNGEGLPCRFGKYTLIRKLAAGGMAELFLAIQKSMAGFEKLLVIKRILPAMNKDRAFIDMLLHEARIAATLSHPNIVQVFDVGEVDGAYFIAMEHVHGEDLRSIVRQMKKKDVVEFPLEHALSMILGVCAGLAYAHDKRDLDGTALNIVHRDVSPQNVVVTFTGDVKIVDFGIAKSDARIEELSKNGNLKGKVPYMSPEQARGEAIDWRSDIFAAGVILFELTTGKRLFKGTSEYDTLKLICEREYPLPSQARLGYPRDLEVIVMRALAKDRAQRWQSAREMQGAIEEFVRKEQLAVSPIALSAFMQALFEDKLASQKQALLQGKQLADIIALESPDSMGSIDTRTPISSAGGASRTLPMVPAARRPGRGLWIAGGAAAIVATAAGIAFWARHGQTEATEATPVPEALPLRGVIAVASDPAGAAIVVNGEVRPETTPARLPRLALGVPYELRVTKDGFEPATQTVTLTELDPSNAVSVVLVRDVPAADSAVAAAPTAKTPPASRAPDRPTGLVAAPAVAVGSGKLNVGARGGWCNVVIDGASRGPTPVAGVVLSAGTHTVTCAPEGGRTQTASVRVEADATARYSFVIPP